MLSSMCYQIVNEPQSNVEYVQDMTHIGAKLRCRFLNESIKLTIGSKVATVAHLKSLVNNVQKSVHGLNSTDIRLIDRQNFRSYQKMVDPRVIDALHTVNDAEGTIKYLQLCSDITSSYMEFDMPPLKRIFHMFRAVFFLRIWKNYLLKTSRLTLKENFITSNAYTGIELNARSLLSSIKNLRDRKMEKNFLPTIFDSQTCEKTFRLLRSFTPVNYTRINFPLFDVLHMFGRVEVQNLIAYFKLPDDQVTYPVSHKREQKTKIYDLPSDEEISQVLKEAKEEAIGEARRFGMECDNIDSYQFKAQQFVEEDIDDIIDTESEDEYFIDDEIEDSMDFNPDDDVIDPESPITRVVDENGQQRFIRKSTLLWILEEPGKKPSKDRLRRCQVSKKRKAE